LHCWFITHNFPPETNAVATRTYEHALEWVKQGASFDILTDIPHFPEGKVYKPYRNRFQHETVNGISVYRMPIYPAENQRRIRRTLSYLSFMVSCLLCSPFVKKKPDVIVATSPQIFTAFAGYLLSVFYRVPFVMEVRDLWPQSIGAVGAIQRPTLLKAIDAMVNHLYRSARRIVVLTKSFATEIAAKGIPQDKLVFIPNGISEDYLNARVDPDRLETLRREHGLEGKFVAAYLGTIGMAHGLDTILEAAQRLQGQPIHFLIVGEGAARRELAAQLERLQLSNVSLLPKQPRSEIRAYLELSDVCLVLLKDLPLFTTVIPSKMLESMGCGRPVILGVRGESQAILERAQAGLAVAPESAPELAEAVAQLAQNRAQCQQMGQRGKSFTLEHYNRRPLAQALWQVLEEAAAKRPT
jgi:glycosyltransferase involved in cell wall biosynthesis